MLAQVAAAAPPPTPTEGLGGFVLGDRAEIRSFSVQSRHPEVDIDDTILTGLSLARGDFRLTATYLPQVVYADFTTPDNRRVAFQQYARTQLSYSTTIRRLTLSIYAAGEYTASNAALLTQFTPSVPSAAAATTSTTGTVTPAAGTMATPIPQTFGLTLIVPPSATIKVGTVRGGVGLGYSFTRRSIWTNSFFASAAKGFDTYSRVVSPSSWTVGASTDYAHLLTHTDTLFSRAIGTYSDTFLRAFPPTNVAGTSKSVIATILEGYRHLWSPRTSGTISLGVSMGSETSTVPGNSSGFNASFSGDGTLFHSVLLGRATVLGFRAGAEYGLASNQFTGRLENQLSAVGGASLTKDRVSVNTTFTGTTTVDATPETQTLAAAIVANYQPFPVLYFYTGATVSRSLYPGQTVTALSVTGQPIANNGEVFWTAFLGVGVTTPPYFF